MKLSRMQRAKIQLSWHGTALRDWLLRWVYAQHNARVIVDFEDRMSIVVYAAPGGMMSKPYYSTQAMLAEIQEVEQRAYEAAYAEGRRDTLDQLGVGEALLDGVDDDRLACPCGQSGCISPVRRD